VQKHPLTSLLAIYFLIENESVRAQSLRKSLPVIFPALVGFGLQVTGDAPLRSWFKHHPVGTTVEKGSDSG